MAIPDMCIPSPHVGAAPAPDFPSMQAAQAFDPAGQSASRGAAQLGRLQLRMLGNPTAATPPAPTPAATPAVTPQAANAGITSPLISSQAGFLPGSSAYIPNLALRLANKA